MRFSIIVPIYNVEKYLRNCIDSILLQTYKQFELILVDDGSPDNCGRICDEYANIDTRINVIHKQNGGLSDARNAGMLVAKGDYLIFVDSDDYWDDENALSNINALIEKYKTQVIQFGHKRYFQKENKYTHLEKRRLEELNNLKTEKIYEELIKKGNFSISACFMCISKQFLLDNNLFFKKGIKSEDIEWAIRMFSRMPSMALSNEKFYVYRMQRDGSITSTIDYKHICNYANLLEEGVEVINNGVEEIKEELFSYLMYQTLIAIALCYRTKITKEQKRSFLLRLKLVCKGRINKYNLDKRVKKASLIYRLFGFSIMAKVLGFYLNHRGR